MSVLVFDCDVCRSGTGDWTLLDHGYVAYVKRSLIFPATSKAFGGRLLAPQKDLKCMKEGRKRWDRTMR